MGLGAGGWGLGWCLGHPGVVLGHPGVILGHPWVILGSSWGHPGVILGSSLVILRSSLVILGHPGDILGHPGVILGSSRVILESSWGHPWSSWSHPGLIDVFMPSKSTIEWKFSTCWLTDIGSSRGPTGPKKHNICSANISYLVQVSISVNIKATIETQN